MRYLPGFGPAVAQECSDCGKKYNMGGPIWSAPIHDMEWVNSTLADVKSMKDRYPAFDRISAVLTTISEVCHFLLCKKLDLDIICLLGNLITLSLLVFLLVGMGIGILTPCFSPLPLAS